MHIFQIHYKGTKSFLNKQIYFNNFSIICIYLSFRTQTLQSLTTSPPYPCLILASLSQHSYLTPASLRFPPVFEPL